MIDDKKIKSYNDLLSTLKNYFGNYNFTQSDDLCIHHTKTSTNRNISKISQSFGIISFRSISKHNLENTRRIPSTIIHLRF
jgi:hypothetical protein